MRKSYDVVVIGGGPAGGQAARNLAKRGYKVLLVERYPTFEDNNFSSAGMTLEPMEEFDLPDSIIGSYWKDISIQCTERVYHWKANKHKGVVLDFGKLRQFLAEEARSYGADLLLGYRYLKKQICDDGVIVELQKGKQTEPIHIKTQLLVDATGPMRRVMYDNKEEQPEMYLGSGTEYLIEVDQETYNAYKDRLVFFLGHKWAIKGYSWIFPMENNILKVGAGKTHLKSNDQDNTDKTTRRITESIIEEYIKPKNCTILDKHGGLLRYSEGLKDLFYHKKVVGVGDAISAINPRGGEGIRYAMQSADLACEYIHDYLTTGNENFEEYRKKWRKRKLFKWRLSEVSARRMYSKYSDQQVENRVKFFHKNFSIEVLIESLFNFKYNQIFSRIFQFIFLKVQYAFKNEKF